MRRVSRAGKLLALPLVIASLYGPQAQAQAQAQISDTLIPFASAVVSYDDNLLRRDLSRVGGDGASDTYRSSVVGVGIDRPIGRQHLTGNVRASKVIFNRFGELDYTGKDAALDLDWRLAHTLSGHVGATYGQSLASFADFQVAARNLRVQKKQYGNVVWRLHPSWQLRAGYTSEDFDFDLPSQQFNNRNEKTVETGFDYLAPSESTFGLLARQVKGKYPTQALNNGVLIDNGFTQEEVKLNVVWNASGISQVIFVGGWARREVNSSSLRNDSGTNGRLIVNWNKFSSVQLTGMVWREFGAAEGVFVNTALSSGQGFNAKWTATSKIEVNAAYKNEKRDFKPLQGVLNLTGLTDTTKTANLSVAYRPLRNISLGLSAFHTERDGSTAARTGSFRAKGAAFNATVSF